MSKKTGNPTVQIRLPEDWITALATEANGKSIAREAAERLGRSLRASGHRLSPLRSPGRPTTSDDTEKTSG